MPMVWPFGCVSWVGERWEDIGTMSVVFFLSSFFRKITVMKLICPFGDTVVLPFIIGWDRDQNVSGEVEK
jgi:hypothetical protein